MSEVETKIESAPIVAQAPVASQEPAAQAETSQETEKDINWRKFREQRELDRKAKEEAIRKAAEKDAEAQALKAAMESLLNKNQPQQYQQQEYQEETEEQRINKHVEAALAKRDQQYEQQRRQREVEETPRRLQEAYNDFDQVCSTSNLDYLDYHYPEITAGYKNQPDSFDKWANIYKAVRKFVPNTDSKKDSKKAESNFQKPQSMSSPGVTHSGNAMPAARLDEKRKADNWARMQKTLKGIS